MKPWQERKCDSCEFEMERECRFGPVGADGYPTVLYHDGEIRDACSHHAWKAKYDPDRVNPEMGWRG